MSSKGGNLRTASSSSASRSGVGTTATSSSVPKYQRHEGGANAVAGKTHGHLRDDGLGQVTFTSSVPLSLAR